MKTYQITDDAKNDLLDIAYNNLNKWGEKALITYRDGLDDVFNAIQDHSIIRKSFSSALPDVFVAKFKYHFIFYIYKSDTAIIIAVIHEKRYVLKQLIHRLEV